MTSATAAPLTTVASVKAPTAMATARKTAPAVVGLQGRERAVPPRATPVVEETEEDEEEWL